MRKLPLATADHLASFDAMSDLATILAMAQGLQFEIVFDDAVATHFSAIHRRDHSAILDAIQQQLEHEAHVSTLNRKPLRIPNSLNASWELRCGKNNRYRVFYDLDIDERTVVVLAVGRKVGNRLFVGDEEFEL